MQRNRLFTAAAQNVRITAKQPPAIGDVKEKTYQEILAATGVRRQHKLLGMQWR